MPIDSLRPHPRNYRTHPEEQLAHIRRSIELHGFYRNVVVARDHTILAGHGVVTAAGQLGLSEVPVRRLDIDPDDPRALQVLAGDNEMGNLADVDDRELTAILADLATTDVDLLLSTGFDVAQLAALAYVTRPPDEIADLDPAGEWVGLPGFAPEPPAPQITVKFATIEERDQFMADVLPGHHIVKKVGDVWTTYWPNRGMNDLAAVRFQTPADA